MTLPRGTAWNVATSAGVTSPVGVTSSAGVTSSVGVTSSAGVTSPVGITSPAGTWVIDLDGVVWRGTTPINGSIEALNRLHDSGQQVVFFTNHAESPRVKEELLASLGVEAPTVITSAEAAAAMCSPGERVLALGEPGLTATLRAAGLDTVDVAEVDSARPAPPVDVVIVGAATHWDRGRTGLAADAVRDGARFIATNDDPTYPYSGPNGPILLPGAGALVAAVAVAAGRSPVVAGKPNVAAAEVVTERFGDVDIVVGDRDDTDGAFARRLGADFALVLSGATGRDEVPRDPAPALVGNDLAVIVETVLAPENLSG